MASERTRKSPYYHPPVEPLIVRKMFEDKNRHAEKWLKAHAEASYVNQIFLTRENAKKYDAILMQNSFLGK